MDGEEYLISKKIDSVAFQKAEPSLWQEWKVLLEQMSTASFTSQKLYLINPIRRRFPLKEPPIAEKKAEVISTPEVTAPKSSKPVFKPKMK